MNDEFKNKIISDLEKSGFGSEMKAIKTFLDHEWNCTGNRHYFDKDERISRQTDLQAYRYINSNINSKACSYFHIIGEVKKSEVPWVVFKEKPHFTTDAWNNLIHYDGLDVHKHEIYSYLNKHSLLDNEKWLGYGVHESFKNPSQASRWYSSFITVCKAAHFVLELEIEAQFSLAAGLDTYLSFIKPVVILDGVLISAEILENGAIELHEIESAAFCFNFGSKEYPVNDYNIDIVTIRGLPNYLDLSLKRHESIHEGILIEK